MKGGRGESVKRRQCGEAGVHSGLRHFQKGGGGGNIFVGTPNSFLPFPLVELAESLNCDGEKSCVVSSRLWKIIVVRMKIVRRKFET